MVSSSVLVKSISSKSTEKSLTKFFSQFGLVESVELSPPNATNKDHSAIVTFINDKSAKAAVSNQGGQSFVDGKFTIVKAYPTRPLPRPTVLQEVNANQNIKYPRTNSASSLLPPKCKQIKASRYAAPTRHRDFQEINDNPVVREIKHNPKAIRHPEISCSYCGFADLASLAYCPQDNCQKWFCNGSSIFHRGNSPEKSHMILHACHSKHTNFKMIRVDHLNAEQFDCNACGKCHTVSQRTYPCSPALLSHTDPSFILNFATFTPQCQKCSQQNIFELGAEDDNDGKNPQKMWCREHATKSDHIAKQRWHPIVANNRSRDYLEDDVFFIRIASWLLKPVSIVDMFKIKGLTLHLWGIETIDRETSTVLEDFWRKFPDGDKDMFLEYRAFMHELVVKRQKQFEDAEEYADYWGEFVKKLAEQEKQGIENLPPMRNLSKITWINWSDLEVVVPFGIFSPYLEMARPLEVADVRTGVPEDATLWSRDACISTVKTSATDTTIRIHLLQKVAKYEQVTATLRIKLAYNDINFWRMNQALFKLKEDPMCMSPQLLGILLGKDSATFELSELLDNDVTEIDTSNTQLIATLEEASSESGTAISEVSDEEVDLGDMPATMNATNKSRGPTPFYQEYANNPENLWRGYSFDQMRSAQVRNVLNAKQRDAVFWALKFPVCCIQGPPGTGKTQTAAAIIYNLLQDKGAKILCCAPSNVAIDHLMAKMIELGVNKTCNMLRLFAHTRDIRSMDKKVQQYTVQGHFKRRHPDAKQTPQILREYERSLVAISDIICTTCNSAGSVSLNGIAFPYVLIDEAAQSTEPDCLIPITRMCEKLILIGDPDQLGAVIPFTNLQKSQLSESLLHRFWDYCPRITLTRQYRMHPDICHMISSITYKGLLESDPSVGIRDSVSIFLDDLFTRFGRGDTKTRAGKPMLFIDISKSDELSGIGTSFVNVTEAHIIARLIANVLESGDPLKPFGKRPVAPKPDQIGVITFYNGQRSHLQTQLDHHVRIFLKTSKSDSSVEIQSVDGFQGREKDIIILSCVKSQTKSLGFTDDAQRLNVAMSRAKRALIVVVDKNVFLKSDIWNQYLSYIPSVDFARFCSGLLMPCSADKATGKGCTICPPLDNPAA